MPAKPPIERASPPAKAASDTSPADGSLLESLPLDSIPIDPKPVDGMTYQSKRQLTAAAELNPQQLAAVTHRGPPLLIVAGAGTGKTKTLVARVVALLESGVDPARILLLTFTRRAAAEMVRRVESSFDGRASSQIWGGTFHSAANRLLRHYGSAAGLADGFTVLDHSDAIDLFGLVRSDEGFGERGKRFPQAKTIASIYSRMVNTQSKLGQILETDFPWCAQNQDELRVLFRSYTKTKRENNVLDYDDLLLFWRGLTDSPIGEALRCLFDHILVDEYQDTNRIQAEIVERMCGPSTELCAVGDDAQAIYGFRAATVANMWNFTSTFPTAEVITLEQNYRSTMPILRVANEVLAQAPQPTGPTGSTDESLGGANETLNQSSMYMKQLWSTRASGRSPALLCCADEGEQSQSVAERILETRERGTMLRDQAVLFRAGHHSDGLELELARRDIPFVKYGGLKYLEAAHVKDLLAMLRILENPDDQLAWRRVLATLDGVGPASVRRLIGELRVGKPNANPLQRFVDGIGRVPGQGSIQAAEIRSALGWCFDHGPNRSDEGDSASEAGSVGSVAEQIDRLKKACESIFPSQYENAAARLADIDQLSATAKGYSSRSRFLTELTLDPPARTGDLAGKPHLDDDWLTLSTIHSAKGCEWSSVYLLHAADGNIPSDLALGSADGLAEELRLLYVAVTRAKSELTISYPLRFHVNRFARDDRHLYAPLSRFLEPLRSHFEEVVAIDQPAESPKSDLKTVGVEQEVDSLLTSLWEN